MVTPTTTAPIIWGLYVRVCGQYPTSSGTRSTVPLGLDSFSRGNVLSGFGTGTDYQRYLQVGTGSTNLTNNEGYISNTTGDLHMVYGVNIGTDEDGTFRFSLTTSTISAGIELRYVDQNNFYRLQASPTALNIVKKSAGGQSTLQTAPVTLLIGTYYHARFRVVGSNPVNLYGRVWPDGVIEQAAWSIVGAD